MPPPTHWPSCSLLPASCGALSAFVLAPGEHQRHRCDQRKFLEIGSKGGARNGGRPRGAGGPSCLRRNILRRAGLQLGRFPVPYGCGNPAPRMFLKNQHPFSTGPPPGPSPARLRVNTRPASLLAKWVTGELGKVGGRRVRPIRRGGRPWERSVERSLPGWLRLPVVAITGIGGDKPILLPLCAARIPATLGPAAPPAFWPYIEALLGGRVPRAAG
jgi:hypothetical protein